MDATKQEVLIKKSVLGRYPREIISKNNNELDFMLQENP